MDNNFIKNIFASGSSGGPNKPNYEQWAAGALLGAMAGYYVYSSRSNSKEITYQEFVQNYLAKNDIEIITLCEDKGNAAFKYRAKITSKSGEAVHLVLPQIENFLYKLDMA